MSASQIFISWSLQSSRQTAERLHGFFRRLFPTFGFFISSEDIKTGQRWYDEISERLGASDVGIIVVTEENYLRPWIHYEAGALAKTIAKTRVMPVLCDISPGLIADTPLSAFQAAELNKAGIWRVAESIRDHSEYSQPESDFREQFEVLWERLGTELCVVESAERNAVQDDANVAQLNPADIQAQLSLLTDIVKSIESRVPAPRTIDDEMHRIINDMMIERNRPTVVEAARYLGGDVGVPTGNALRGLNFGAGRNALNPTGAAGRKATSGGGLLGTVRNEEEAPNQEGEK